MQLYKALGFITIIAMAVCDCGGRCAKDSHRDGNAAQANELSSVSQAIDSLRVRAVTETEDVAEFYSNGSSTCP